MPTLHQTLQDRDLGFLRTVAELWGFDPPTGSALEAAATLSHAMLDRQALAEHVETLSPPSRDALAFLQSHGGRHPVSDAERRFGPIRPMGPGRRDREKPWLAPASPLEDLWYRGLLARAFTDTPAGPQEFFFIPGDLLSLLPTPNPPTEPPPALPVPAPAWSRPATLAAADDATTLLAALRCQAAKNLPLEPARARQLMRFLIQPASSDLLLTLLVEAGLLSSPPHQPQPDTARAFLDLGRLQAVRHLFQVWRASMAWNDLARVPSLSSPSRVWPNDPLLARRVVLALLSQLPPHTWYSLDSFVASLRERQPDFQRPAGDFDSWYLQDWESGAFLQGFEHWEQVEGALLRYLLSGPLHWLGLIDLGGASDGQTPTAFRLSQHAGPLLEVASGGEDAQSPFPSVSVTPDGSVLVPRSVPLALRYQIARFTAWEGMDEQGWRHRLTPSSIQAGRRQGLKPGQMRAVLESACLQPLPATLLRALTRHEERGCEARFERMTLLRVSRPQVLQELKRNRATARYLGEELGPTTVQVRERDWDALRHAAARLGLLIDPPADGLEP